MRSFIVTILSIFVAIPIIFTSSIVFGFYLGNYTENPLIGFSSGFLCLGIMYYVSVKIINHINAYAFRRNMDNWLDFVVDCKYVYGWDGYGIAIDVENKKIHLNSIFGKDEFSRSYKFSDIREWGYKVPGANLVSTFGNVGANAALGVTAHNMMSIMSAEKNSGIWLKTRDTEFPLWFIRFGGNIKFNKIGVINEMERWMEILNQEVNEG